LGQQRRSGGGERGGLDEFAAVHGSLLVNVTNQMETVFTGYSFFCNAWPKNSNR